MDTQPSKICRGSTHDFQCTTTHHDGYLEWHFNFHNSQEELNDVFQNNAIKGTTRKLSNSIRVNLTDIKIISTGQDQVVYEYTSIAHVLSIIDQMTIIFKRTFHGNKRVGVQWYKPGRCCNEYKISVGFKKYVTSETKIEFPLNNEITYASIFCWDGQGQLGTGKKLQFDSSMKAVVCCSQICSLL